MPGEGPIIPPKTIQPPQEKILAGIETEKKELTNLLDRIEKAQPGDYIGEFNFNNLATEAEDSLRQGNLEYAKNALNVLKKAQNASLEGVRIAVPPGANLDYLEKEIAKKEYQK